MKRKNCAELADWTKATTNHLWWSAKTCEGYEKKLKESWLSLKYHTVNKHSWKIGKRKYKCNHLPLSCEKVKRTKWLKPGSPAHLAIQEVISDPKLLKDLDQVTNACHTAELESFHSLLTKYSPKRQEFDYDVMLARSQLAIMDHNHNVNRNQVITSKPSARGKQGEQQFRFAFSKATKEWQAKPVKERKSYEFIHQLMTDAIEMRRSGP